MGLLDLVQHGKTQMPPRIMTYGTEGIGKSTLASRAPKPVFVQTEDGLNEIDCAKFPLARTLDDVLAALTELAVEEHPYESVVIDSLDWLERMVWDAVCKRESATTIEKVGGGYGKGYILALDYWRRLIDFDFLVEEGVISPEDTKLFEYVDTPQDAWAAIARFYKL